MRSSISTVSNWCVVFHRGPRVRRCLSPRAWGWTVLDGVVGRSNRVVPTRVGVDRAGRCDRPVRRGCPHARGGGPVLGAFRCQKDPTLSPRAWGWTVAPERQRHHDLRCPHVRGGGPQVLQSRPRWMWRCPHARGGGPSAPFTRAGTSQLSPRAWGWTASGAGPDRGSVVVPTRVGVDRSGCRPRHRARPLSPRAWGWTETPGVGQVLVQVVPTRVGVDRRYWRRRRSRCPLSPRAWGWTEVRDPGRPRRRVVPTRVGVDRLVTRPRVTWLRCPHARGGGPGHSSHISLVVSSCPHASGGDGNPRSRVHL